MKLFILSPESTKASEKCNLPGDNAIFTLIKMLKEHGYTNIDNEVAMLPGERPLPLLRRSAAISKHSEADATLIMGDDTYRKVKSWFPVNEALKLPQPFFFIHEPGRVILQIIPQLEELAESLNLNEKDSYGFNTETKTFG